MAQFHAHRTRDGSLVMDCQSPILHGLDTTLVVPLEIEGRIRSPFSRMNPVLEINGSQMVLYPQGMATIPTSELSEPVADLEEQRDRIIGAIDVLITGV
ncbi:MAG: CcdB family protein [Pacificimonas sp.]